MRLTSDVVLDGEIRYNPLMHRELILRDLKIPAIENLGVTKDQFDSFDLAGNSIVLLDNFPLLPRLKVLNLPNNKICKIAKGLGKSLENIISVVLSNNEIATLDDLRPLQEFHHLERLVLKGNPVVHSLNYRLFVLHILPQLRYLDFIKVSSAEVQRAIQVFGDSNSPQGKAFAETNKTPIQSSASQQLTDEQKQSIRSAIENSSSLEEIDRLQQILQSGKFPL